mmetsp:Transcript_4183/g.13981  ORF Transcript_4183/g.13981 Transcript_4183/m.13981 type:complete len:236 (-) Transcript_4183:304-1011(-)
MAPRQAERDALERHPAAAGAHPRRALPGPGQGCRRGRRQGPRGGAPPVHRRQGGPVCGQGVVLPLGAPRAPVQPPAPRLQRPPLRATSRWARVGGGRGIGRRLLGPNRPLCAHHYRGIPGRPERAPGAPAPRPLCHAIRRRCRRLHDAEGVCTLRAVSAPQGPEAKARAHDNPRAAVISSGWATPGCQPWTKVFCASCRQLCPSSPRHPPAAAAAPRADDTAGHAEPSRCTPTPV